MGRVNDIGTGWLTTKDLSKPRGWAFAHLEREWDAFAERVSSQIDAMALTDRVSYVYRAHDLDMADQLLAAAEADASGRVAEAMFSHLARHWSWYGPMSEAVVALVPTGKVPSMRTPARALGDELRSAGDDLWLVRLQNRGICPTSRGPRTPASTWQPSLELERRFGRAGRPASSLLPVLVVEHESHAVRIVADRLMVRRELSPSTFRASDALTICERIEKLWAAPVTADLSKVKPIYRDCFELLTRESGVEAGSLTGAPLLALTPEGLRYLKGPQLLHARTPGARERSGVSDAVSVFVLEAEPSVAAPIVSMFGARILEESLRWEAESEEVAFADDDLKLLRAQLHELADVIIARVKVERNSDAEALRDSNVVRSLLREMQPVTSLKITCSLDGERLAVSEDRAYHLETRRGTSDVLARVMWPEQPWPPTPEASTALALALSEALGISLVEAFDSLIRSEPGHRLRMLALAGGESHWQELQATGEVEAQLGEEDQASDKPTAMPGAVAAGAPPVESGAERRAPAAPIIALYDPRCLMIDGDPLPVDGEQGAGMSGADGGTHGQPGSVTRAASGRAAPGTDLCCARRCRDGNHHRL